MVLTLRRSKTDRERQGQVIAIPYGRHEATCPVLAVETSLDASGITAGPVFRAVDGHSNASGKSFSDRAVASEHSIMNQTRHLSARRLVHRGQPWADYATGVTDAVTRFLLRHH